MTCRRACLAMASFILALAFLHPAIGQLTVDFSVNVTLGDDGIYTYDYSLRNMQSSSQSINSILLTTGLNAPIVDVVGPNDNWFASYAVEEEVFQAGFATGLSPNGEDCGATDAFDLFQGQTIAFSMTSPWAPSDQRYAIGRTVGRGAACDFVGDFATGMIASPTTEIAECDFDRDGDCDVVDIDSLAQAIAELNNAPRFDLNLDTMVNQVDLDLFLSLNRRLNGDTDFNGRVEFADFLIMSGNFSQNASWSQGDFDANGNVAFADFLILSGNFGKSVLLNAVVPEPGTGQSLTAGALLCAIVVSRIRCCGRNTI